MNKKYNYEQKQAVLESYVSGKSVSELVPETNIPRSTIYSWIAQQRNEQMGEQTKFTLHEYRKLENNVKRLEGMVEILKRVDCTVNAPLGVRLQALEALYGQYSVHMLCEALNVPRGTFYNHILRNKRNHTWYAKRREELRMEIQKIYDDNRQIFGAAKITAVLKEDGYRVSEEMVRELMRDMGLISIRQGSKEQYDKEQLRYKNHLNQQFDATRPNEIWVGDVTYFRYKEKNFYICAILDLYARRVVGIRVGKRNSTQLTKGTFKAAYESRKPNDGLLFHTDRGANYRSNTFSTYLKSLGVQQSFSRAHIPYDNSVMESFFASMKREELYRTKYRSEKELRAGITAYIEFYNERRPHAKNGYKTPQNKELKYWENIGVPAPYSI